MTEIQVKLLQLMDEVDAICKKENLRYVLTHQTAAYVNNNEKFINSMCEFQILMTLSDIHRLQVAIMQVEGKERREFESWENNPALQQMTFRYVDKDSLLYDGESGELHTKPGIAITIFAAKMARPSRTIMGCERYLQMYNSGRKRTFWIKITAVKIIKKIFGNKVTRKLFKIRNVGEYITNTAGVSRGGMLSVIMGLGKLSKYVMNSELKSDLQMQSGEKNDELLPEKWIDYGFWFMRKDGHLAGLSKDLFLNPQFVTFEKRIYPIPTELDNYLRNILGRGWKKQAYNAPIANRIHVVSDATMPYEEYLSYVEKNHVGKTLEDDVRSCAKFDCWTERVLMPAEEKSYQTYTFIRSSIDRINVWYHLNPKRKEIRMAYAERDLEKLKDLLNEYLVVTEKYKNKGIGFYIDDEIYESAKLIWDAEDMKKFANEHSCAISDEGDEANTDESMDSVEEDAEIETYAEKIYSMAPEFYKEETMDEYFANRRKA